MAQVKEVRGPGPRGAGQPRPKVENPGLLLKRIMDEVFQHYLPHCIFVLVCIVVSALANVQASLFLKTLIDDYIVPMTQQATPDFGPLAAALGRIGCVYAVGVLAAWLNSRIMVNVTQGTLRNLRTKLFTHMESLPIRYFDQHPHGDIMSVYTNDVDTLRQMLSQSIPQLTSSAITIVSVLTSMVLMSWQLTIVTLCMVALMLFCTKKITSMSGKYFIAQQKDLGKVNGYIEEMMEGQKVVKVFTHEQKTLDGFRALNDKLKDSAKQANSYANIIMPVTAQEECIRVAKLACADEFIERFPDKYNTWIEQGGSNVSGGQKQRLTIARALLRKPKVLILDDSTSAVDTATDAKIRKAFREEIPGTTKIIIAQRISSVQDADRILVLDNGQINGLGTHEELLKTNTIYQEVYNSQTQGSGDFDKQGGEQ